MNEELLSLVCREYQKMTGLESVTSETKIVPAHVNSLTCRLEKNLNFRILWPRGDQFPDNIVIADFLPCIEEGCQVYDGFIAEISEVAEKLVEHKYDPEHNLFADLPRAEAGLYLFKLKQILLKRRGKENVCLDGVKISEIADSMFSYRKKGFI